MKIKRQLGIALASMAAGMLAFSCSEKFDPSYLEDQISHLENTLEGVLDRVTKLENTVNTINSDIRELNRQRI